MLELDLGEKLQRKIEMGTIEGSNSLGSQQAAWFQHITSIVSLPRYMVNWCSSPITAILSKLRESGSSSSSSLPVLEQNLTALNHTELDETTTEEVVIKSKGLLFGFFSDMLDNLISYYPVTLVIGEEKKDMFSISLVLTCAVVSCCVTLVVNFLISRWNSCYYCKRMNEDQINYGKEQEEEEDHGDFPMHRLSNLTTLNNSNNINNINNAAPNGRSRSHMTMSSSQCTNNNNQFQDTFKLLQGQGISSICREGKTNATNTTDSSNIHNLKKLSTLEPITLNQFPRGNFSPCFEMHGMALETILRLSRIPHVVNCVSGQLGPSITFHDGTKNTDIWGLQSIFNFLKNNYADEINRFLTPPEYELQAEFINIYVENRVCWLLYHWRWFYGINCKIKKFAWSNIHKAYIELAASSWNRLFGDTSIDCLVDEILKSFNVLSQLLGEKDYFIHDSICDVDIRIFAVLSQCLFSMPTTTLEGLIKAKPNLVNFCHRIRNIAWQDWEACLQKNDDCGGGEGDGDTNQSFDDISYSDNPTSNSNSELQFDSPHHYYEGDIPESMLPKSRTKTKKHSTIPFYCPPEIHTFHPDSDEDSKIIDRIKEQQSKQDIISWHKNTSEDAAEPKEDYEYHNNVGTSASEIPRALFNNEYYNHNDEDQILGAVKEIQIQVGTSRSEVCSSLDDDNKMMSCNNSTKVSDPEIEFLTTHFHSDKMTDENIKKEKKDPNINTNSIHKMKACTNDDLHDEPTINKTEGILDIQEPYFDFDLKLASSNDKIDNGTSIINKSGKNINNNNNSLDHGDQVSTLSMLRNNDDDDDVCALSVTKLKKVVNNNKSKIPVIKR